MSKVLIIGSNGLLGSSLSKYLEKMHEVVTVTRLSEDSDFQLDMSSTSKSQKKISEIKPDYIINLAAITNVDTCEDNVKLAYNVNTKIAENIALYCNNKNVFVVHISTDHIYNKNISSENEVEIQNNYALTKYFAEKCYNTDDNAVVLRTNFFGKSESENSKGLCDTIYDQVQKGVELNLFNDVYFSPLSINTLTNIIARCLKCKIPGVFNVGSKEGMSKERFLLEFLNQSGVNDFKHNSLSVDELNLKTTRPKDMRMDVSLFESVYKYNLPKLKTEIESVANEFKKYSI